MLIVRGTPAIVSKVIAQGSKIVISIVFAQCTQVTMSLPSAQGIKAVMSMFIAQLFQDQRQFFINSRMDSQVHNVSATTHAALFGVTFIVQPAFIKRLRTLPSVRRLKSSF